MSLSFVSNREHRKPQLQAALIAPDIPLGYGTIASWWATEMWQAVDLLSDPLVTFLDDEEALCRRAADYGIEPLWVRPSPFAASQGRAREPVFPISLLEEFYPENP